MYRPLRLILVVILLITCSGCFWVEPDGGGRGDRNRGDYGDHDRGGHGDQDRERHYEQERH